MKRLWFQVGMLFFGQLLLWIGEHLLLSSFPFLFQTSTFINEIVLVSTPSVYPSPDAMLGAVAAIVVALIAGCFIIYQVRQNKKLTHENERIQYEKEGMQRRLDAATHRQQTEDDAEKSRYDDWLTARREAQEHERQRKESARLAARSVMVAAHTPAQRDDAYRKALHADTNISRLQILDMAHPMEVARVYVRLRLQQEVRLTYDIEPSLIEAEKHGDPNTLLRARFSSLEQRTQAALTPEAALQKYAHCIVLGDPGAGKSTLLKYLTLRSIDQQLPNIPSFPIHIVLSDFANSANQDLIGFAAKRWDEWYGFSEEEARAHMESHLTTGNALLLLDALDETVIGGSDDMARASYTRVLEAINRVKTRYSTVPIVITARKAGYYRRANLSGFTELEILDFRPEEIKEFVENWFTYHPARPQHATAAELNIQLQQNPRIQSLATNPLLLCLIVMVYESRQDLPEKRSSIYKDCIDTLLYRWDTSRDIRRRRAFKIEHKQQLLVEIAWHFHLQGRRYFPEDELLAVIAKFLPTVGRLAEEKSAILSEIEEENGLLKEQAHGWHGFLHLTLQEYLVAQHLIGVPDGLEELLKQCGDPWWEEVMLLYSGSVADASPLLHALLQQEKKQWFWKDIFHTSLLWAGQCLTTRPRLVRSTLSAEIVNRLFALLREQDCYALTREQVIKILLAIEGNDAKRKILFVLKDKQDDRSVRGSVAQALGRLGEKTVVPELLAVLKDKQNESYVRWYVAQALGQLGEKVVVSELLAVLKDKQDESDVRGSVARALGQLGEKAVVSELLAVLKDKQDESDVRGSVARALGRLGKKAVVSELLAVLKDKQDKSDVRWSVALALRQLGEKTMVPELLAVLKDKQDNRSVRGSVAQALGQLGEKAVVPKLLAVLKDKQNESDVRGPVAQALGQLGEKTVVPELLAVLKDKQNDRDVHWSVAQALGQLGEKAVVPELLAVLKDKQNKSYVRGPVAEALIVLGQREPVLPYLYLIVKDAKDSPTNLDSAGEWMWNIASLRAFLPLLKQNHTRDDIHRVFWAVSQREKVRILMFRWRFVKFVRVMKR